MSWVEIPMTSNPTQWTVHCKSSFDLMLSVIRMAHILQVNGEIKGTGIASQKAAARQSAAKQACEVGHCHIVTLHFND